MHETELHSFKYINYELPERQSARTDEDIITGYKYTNILTVNASNVISNNIKKSVLTVIVSIRDIHFIHQAVQIINTNSTSILQ